MKLFCLKVIDRAVSGGGTIEYSDPKFETVLARADKYCVFVRTSQPGGTGPKMSITLEHSNDGVNWTEKTALWSGFNYSTTATGAYFASDTGANVGGRFARLSIALGGTDPAAHFQIWVCGRGRRVAAG